MRNYQIKTTFTFYTILLTRCMKRIMQNSLSTIASHLWYNTRVYIVSQRSSIENLTTWFLLILPRLVWRALNYIKMLDDTAIGLNWLGEFVIIICSDIFVTIGSKIPFTAVSFIGNYCSVCGRYRLVLFTLENVAVSCAMFG